MRKTLFAGLTVLDADESIIDDGGAFIGRDRDTIDRLLQIGAKTHRHDGSAGLSNPAVAMGASAVASGGQIPSDVTMSIGYTLEDDHGGETILSPAVTKSTRAAMATPSQAPTAVADYAAGDLGVDSYYYAYSFMDGEGGETPIGPYALVQRAPGYANARVLLTHLDDGVPSASAAGWRLYRAVGGGGYHFLASGTGDSFTDDGSRSVNCDIEPLVDGVNSTNGTNSLVIQLPSPVAPAEQIDVYLTTGGEFVGNVLLGTFPAASAGQRVVYRSLDLDPGQPPDTNQSIGGADLIDPDTDMLDWHWKRPVQTVAALGSGTKGDVRFVHNASGFYYLPADGAASGDWDPVPVGSGGGGGGGSMDVTDGTTTVIAPPVLEFDPGDFEVTDDGGNALVVSLGGGGGPGPGASGIGVFDGTTSTLYPGVYEIDLFGFDVGYAIDPGTPGVLAINPTAAAGGCVKATYPYNTSSLADGATEDGFVDTSSIQNANVISVLEVVADNECRVRLYASAADQSADSARPFGTDPTGDHGVLLDVEIGSGLSLRINPATLLYTSDGSSNFYISVENMSGGTTAVSVDLNAIAVVAP